MRVLLVLAFAIGAVIAAPKQSQRIVGGGPTIIDSFPSVVAVLFSFTGNNFRQTCGGAILNYRSVVTVAHCVYQDSPYRWQLRAGSADANSGGFTYTITGFYIHDNFNLRTLDSDIAILRISGTFFFLPNQVQVASIAGSNYVLGDTQPVWAAGWGATAAGGDFSDQLHDVQLWTINQNVCAQRYLEIPFIITDNMVCAGILDSGGHDQCQGDAGSPIYHHGVVVGLSSFGYGCGQPRYPGVNTRISPFTTWIQMYA